jgi:hypothetical protein
MGGALAGDRRKVTRRKSRNNAHGRRVVPGDAGSSSVSFSAERWSKIAAVLPGPVKDSDRLREHIVDCCNAYLSGVRAAQRGGATVDAITRGGGKQPAPLERLVSQLKAAQETWDGIRDMHDDHLGLLSDLDDLLPRMIVDAERRLAILRSSDRETVSIKFPLIRDLAHCLKTLGYRPTATGQIYGSGKPTWFQQFVQAINDSILGAQGWGAPASYSENALYADVAKAMSGYEKPG